VQYPVLIEIQKLAIEIYRKNTLMDINAISANRIVKGGTVIDLSFV